MSDHLYDRILVPLDGTTIATGGLAAALRLAARWSAHVEVISLLRTGDRLLGVDEAVKLQVARLKEPELGGSESGTDPSRTGGGVPSGTATAVDVNYTIRDMEYSVVDDIACLADDVDNTLVVMSSSARDRSAALLPNVAEDVMRHLRQPVLFVGPDAEVDDSWPDGQLGVCTDGSDFGNAILPLAAAWASGLNLTPNVLTVINPSTIPEVVDVAAESNVSGRTARKLGALTGGTVEFDVLHGDEPAAAIVDYCRIYELAMVAIASHSRGGIGRLLHGSEAMRVVHEAPCPVLIQRP